MSFMSGYSEAGGAGAREGLRGVFGRPEPVRYGKDSEKNRRRGVFFEKSALIILKLKKNA